MAENSSTPLNHYDEAHIIIRESHLDSFGHVNNAKYLEILEDVRWDLITSRGYGYKEVHALKIGPVILEVRLQFKHELHNREECTVRTSVTSHKGKITNLRQTIINAQGEEVCQADFVLGLFDLKARKLIEPTPAWRKALAMP